jgi:cell division septal protein FtsQ
MTAPTLETQTIAVDFTDRRPRRRRRIRVAAGVLAILVAGVAAWLVWFSPVFSITSVRVVGVDGSQAGAALAAAAIPVGIPLARLDADASTAAVLELPWVASAEVRRGWPNEVVIAVQPRTALAVDGTSRRGVDASGVAFDAATRLPATLPVVTASGVGMQAAMAVIAALPPDLAPRVAKVSATTRDDVDLVLRSGAVVHWGSAETVDFKARVLRALMRHKQDVYDVTAPELPTTFTAG